MQCHGPMTVVKPAKGSRWSSSNSTIKGPHPRATRGCQEILASAYDAFGNLLCHDLPFEPHHRFTAAWPTWVAVVYPVSGSPLHSLYPHLLVLRYLASYSHNLRFVGIALHICNLCILLPRPFLRVPGYHAVDKRTVGAHGSLARPSHPGSLNCCARMVIIHGYIFHQWYV